MLAIVTRPSSPDGLARETIKNIAVFLKGFFRVLDANIHIAKLNEGFLSAVCEHLLSECVLMFLLVVGRGERDIYYTPI